MYITQIYEIQIEADAKNIGWCLYDGDSPHIDL